MDKNQLERLRYVEEYPRTLNVDMMVNLNDRTLLWGYTKDSTSWHVYMLGGEIHIHVYNSEKTLWHESGTEFDLDEIAFVPNKRLYPEACDFEFCKLLKKLGVHLPFTTFRNDREEKQFYGKKYGWGY